MPRRVRLLLGYNLSRLFKGVGLVMLICIGLYGVWLVLVPLILGAVCLWGVLVLEDCQQEYAQELQEHDYHRDAE